MMDKDVLQGLKDLMLDLVSTGVKFDRSTVGDVEITLDGSGGALIEMPEGIPMEYISSAAISAAVAAMTRLYERRVFRKIGIDPNKLRLNFKNPTHPSGFFRIQHSTHTDKKLADWVIDLLLCRTTVNNGVVSLSVLVVSPDVFLRMSNLDIKLTAHHVLVYTDSDNEIVCESMSLPKVDGCKTFEFPINMIDPSVNESGFEIRNDTGAPVKCIVSVTVTGVPKKNIYLKPDDSIVLETAPSNNGYFVLDDLTLGKLLGNTKDELKKVSGFAYNTKESVFQVTRLQSKLLMSEVDDEEFLNGMVYAVVVTSPQNYLTLTRNHPHTLFIPMKAGRMIPLGVIGDLVVGKNPKHGVNTPTNVIRLIREYAKL